MPQPQADPPVIQVILAKVWCEGLRTFFPSLGHSFNGEPRSSPHDDDDFPSTVDLYLEAQVGQGHSRRSPFVSKARERASDIWMWSFPEMLTFPIPCAVLIPKSMRQSVAVADGSPSSQQPQANAADGLLTPLEPIVLAITIWSDNKIAQDDFVCYGQTIIPKQSLPVLPEGKSLRMRLRVPLEGPKDSPISHMKEGGAMLDLEIMFSRVAEAPVATPTAVNRILSNLGTAELDATATLTNGTLRPRTANAIALQPVHEMNFALLDGLFEHPLAAHEPVLQGQRQRLDIHKIRERARHISSDSRIVLFASAWLLAVVLFMLILSHTDDHGGWETVATVVYVISISISIAEIILYGIGFGVLPTIGSKNEGTKMSRVWSILSVWLPARLRQGFREDDALDAHGHSLLGHGPLLQDGGWIAEIVLIILTIIGYALPGGNHGTGLNRLRYLHGLRAFRLVTPLSKLIPSLSFLTTALQSSFAMIAATMTFLAFFFIIFGVLGVGLFKGAVSYRCVLIDPQLNFNYTTTNVTRFEFCRGLNRSIIDQCVEASPPIYCDINADHTDFWTNRVCHFPMVCRELPTEEYATFDDIFHAWLTMAIMASLSNWSAVMYSTWASNPTIFAGLFCILLIITVSFMTLNFVSAIIASAYAKARSTMKVVGEISRHREKKRSFIVFAFDQIVWWNFSSDIVRHLTYADEKKSDEDPAEGATQGLGMIAKEEFDDEGRINFEGRGRSPFFAHIRFRAFSEFTLLGIVAVHSINGTHMPSSYWDGMRIVDIVYTSYFGVEMLLSIIACGSIGKYFLNDWRKFEGLSFISAIIGCSLRIPLTPVRSIRWVRILQRLPWARRTNLFNAILRSGVPALVVVLLVLVVIFVMTAVSVQLFSTKSVDETDNKANGSDDGDAFNSITLAITSIFRLVTSDEWENLMFTGMKAQNWFLAILFFVPGQAMFNYLLTSLFTAVVLDTFEPRKEIKLAWQQKQHDEEAEEQFEAELAEVGEDTGSKGDSKKDRKSAKGKRRPRSSSGRANASTPQLKPPSPAEQFSLQETHGEMSVGNNSITDEARLPQAVRKLRQIETHALASPGSPSQSKTFASKVTRVEKKVKDKSLAIFGVDNAFRKFIARIVVNKSDLQLTAEEAEKAPPLYGHWFQWFIILFVLFSCVLVAIAPPSEACSLREVRSDTWLNLNLAADIIFAVIFTVEMLLKMIAHGVLFPGDDRPPWYGPSYFRDIWNVFDFFLLVGMFVAFGYAEARPFRLFRVLRPLRVVRRVENMRLLANGIVNSLPNLMLVFVFSVYLLFIFAIAGTGMFAGKLWYCNAAVIGGYTVQKNVDCRGLYVNDQGVLAPASWLPYKSRFDHVGLSMSFLLEVASLSNWNQLLSQVLNIAGVDQQPRQNANVAYAIYFFIFVLLTAFWLVNVVVAVLLASLDEQRGVLYLTKHQREWFTLRKEMLKLKPRPRPPFTPFSKIQSFVSSRKFDFIINCIVVVNIISMATVHQGQNRTWHDLQFYSNLVFLIIFVIEMILKLLAFGKYYFLDAWNVLDCFITVLSIVEFIVQVAQNTQDIAISSVGRAIRIIRILRSIRSIPTLRGLFHTLLHSLPAIFSVSGFLFIVLFMYSVLAMVVFGSIRYQASYNKDANFRSIDVSFLTLFRMLTLDGWDSLMNDLKWYTGVSCTTDQEGWWYVDPGNGSIKSCGLLNDCSTTISLIFFYSFYAVGSYLFLNLVVAIMLDNFNYIATQTKVRIRIDHLDGYQACWLKARRALGHQNNYDSLIEPELLSSFIIALFNQENALVKNEAEQRNIHPVLTAQSRMNYRKLVHELETEAARLDLPKGKHCSFQGILLACARLQMGKDALTLKQRLRRERFEEEMTLKLVGKRIQSDLRALMTRIRGTVSQRKAAELQLRLFEASIAAAGASRSESPTVDLSTTRRPLGIFDESSPEQTLELRRHGRLNLFQSSQSNQDDEYRSTDQTPAALAISPTDEHPLNLGDTPRLPPEGGGGSASNAAGQGNGAQTSGSRPIVQVYWEEGDMLRDSLSGQDPALCKKNSVTFGEPKRTRQATFSPGVIAELQRLQSGRRSGSGSGNDVPASGPPPNAPPGLRVLGTDQKDGPVSARPMPPNSKPRGTSSGNLKKLDPDPLHPPMLASVTYGSFRSEDHNRKQVASTSVLQLPTPGISADADLLLTTVETEEEIRRMFIKEAEFAVSQRMPKLRFEEVEVIDRDSIRKQYLAALESIPRKFFVEEEDMTREVLQNGIKILAWRLSSEEAARNATPKSEVSRWTISPTYPGPRPQVKASAATLPPTSYLSAASLKAPRSFPLDSTSDGAAHQAATAKGDSGPSAGPCPTQAQKNGSVPVEPQPESQPIATTVWKRPFDYESVLSLSFDDSTPMVQQPRLLYSTPRPVARRASKVEEPPSIPVEQPKIVTRTPPTARHLPREERAVEREEPLPGSASAGATGAPSPADSPASAPRLNPILQLQREGSWAQPQKEVVQLEGSLAVNEDAEEMTPIDRFEIIDEEQEDSYATSTIVDLVVMETVPASQGVHRHNPTATPPRPPAATRTSPLYVNPIASFDRLKKTLETASPSVAHTGRSVISGPPSPPPRVLQSVDYSIERCPDDHRCPQYCSGLRGASNLHCRMYAHTCRDNDACPLKDSRSHRLYYFH